MTEHETDAGSEQAGPVSKFSDQVVAPAELAVATVRTIDIEDTKTRTEH